MADFYKEPNPINDPDYTRASKGYSTPKVDTTFSDLFKGVGNLAVAGIGAADQVIQSNIKEDARNAIDPIRDAHGANLLPDEVTAIAGNGARGKARAAATPGVVDSNSPTGLPEGNPEGLTDISGRSKTIDGNDTNAVVPENTSPQLPPAAQGHIDAISRMSDRYNAGQLSNSRYYAELQVAAQSLYNRYPGYADQVDQVFKSVAGIVPANALRASLVQDMNANAAAQAAGQNDYQKWLVKNGSDVARFVAPDYFENPQKYAHLSQGQVQDLVFRGQAAEQNLKANDLVNTHNVKAATQTMNERFAYVANNTLAGLSRSAGVDQPSVMSQYLTMSQKGGEGIDVGNVSRTLGATEQVLRQALQAEAFKLRDTPNGKQSYYSIVGPQAVSESIEAAVKEIVEMRKHVDNKDFLASSAIANQTLHKQKLIEAGVYEAAPGLAVIKTITDASGTAANTVLTSTATLPSLQRALTDATVAKIAGLKDASQIPTLSQIIDKGNKAQIEQTPEAQRAYINNWKIMVQTSKDPQVSANFAKSLFDEKYFAGLPTTQQNNVFSQLVSPQMSERMKVIGKTDPDALHQYVTFATSAFKGLYKEAASNAAATIPNPDTKTEYDPESNQLKVSFAGKGIQRPSMSDAAYSRRVADFNRGLKQMEGVFEAAGIKKDQYIPTLLTSMGIDLNAPKQDPLIDTIWKKVKPVLEEASKH